MPTVTGTLQTILNSGADVGTVEVALCGYGSRVPRLNNQALSARTTDDEISVASNGTFSFVVDGNDVIAPPGTYYTVTIKDDNGDIVQVNAYLFLSTQSSYNLNSTDPYDPTQPPPPLPPLIFNLLLILGPADAMNFPGDTYTAFKTTLPGDVTQPFTTNMMPGNLYTFIIVQDGVGNHRFLWPTTVHNGCYVDPRPNATTVQTFVVDENQQLWAIAPGTSYP